jgi:hypothetical protein
MWRESGVSEWDLDATHTSRLLGGRLHHPDRACSGSAREGVVDPAEVDAG